MPITRGVVIWIAGNLFKSYHGGHYSKKGGQRAIILLHIQEVIIMTEEEKEKLRAQAKADGAKVYETQEEYDQAQEEIWKRTNVEEAM